MRLQIPELVCFPKLAEKLPSVPELVTFSSAAQGQVGKYKEPILTQAARAVSGRQLNVGTPTVEGDKAVRRVAALRRVNGHPLTCKVHLFHTVVLLQDSVPSCENRADLPDWYTQAHG